MDSLSIGFIEELYAQFLQNPLSVSSEWRDYFLKVAPGGASTAITHPSFKTPGLFDGKYSGGNGQPKNGKDANRERINFQQDRVDQLIRAYRVRGHLMASLDPLNIPRPKVMELDPAYYGLTEADLRRTFSTVTIKGPDVLSLEQILEQLRATYCQSIGVQYMHIDNAAIKEWLQDRMEGSQNRIAISRETQIRILSLLTDSVFFEQFIQKKFIGAKSFSLEGAESLIPLLYLAIEKAGDQNVEDIVLGMAHRGRLNVLSNILGKNARQIFREFADLDGERNLGRGDVKYHLGYSRDWKTQHGKNLHLSLCFNPSHLEFVNPVVLGRVRARQDRARDLAKEKSMAILIHGDAAFIGEGVAQETLNLSELEGYKTGGTLHVVINNQIGFTTSPDDGRSTVYATDIAKMLQIPIFHVNGENPEAVAQVVNLAMDFRHQFKRDVVIDMYCYRLHGHNESDEPAFTQPLMYQTIRNRKSVREGYLDHLLELKGITAEEADRIAEERKVLLEKELSEAHSKSFVHPETSLTGLWKKYQGGPADKVKPVDTGIAQNTLQHLLNTMTQLPSDFKPHAKIEKFLQTRRDMAAGNKPIDWANAEALAFGTLALEGHPVRLSGQDCKRGTFSHRHAVFFDYETGKQYMPLAHLDPNQARVDIFNSPLSETGVMGFDYGYSLDFPDGLTLWEAQFGDFCNVAQVIIDQFLASAEDKWGRLSGLTLLLPHGFEGQGPEHSSARIERWLTLAAKDNMQIVNCSTPAQYFHVLRRQVKCPWRKPLVIFTPKSLLRHPECVSPMADFTDAGSSDRFQLVIADETVRQPKLVIFCSGKVYYDLLKERKERQLEKTVAINRLEQYYPFPRQDILNALQRVAAETPVCWVQEEPENMGVWRFIRVHFGDRIDQRFPFLGFSRPEASSPATGSANSHKIEQKQLFDRVFAVLQTVKSQPKKKQVEKKRPKTKIAKKVKKKGKSK